MATRIIAAASAAWEVDGKLIEAHQGAEVDLPEEVEALLEEQGALVPPGFDTFQAFSDYKLDLYRAGRGAVDGEAAARLAAARAGGIADLSAPTNDASALTQYIRENQPTVDETVALAQGKADLAQIVLEAERTATGDEPRKGVEEGLERIIEGGDEG